MERKHKYKAWDKINNKWLNDEFIISTQSKGAIEFCGVSTDNDASLINEDVIFIQFTGLHDKNGEEIYEGDILNVDCASVGGAFNDGIHQVEYILPDCAFSLIQIDGKFGIAFNECYEYEVIGNKFESK
jgi:uncharacterized phage protein (TIGR01671 family)